MIVSIEHSFTQSLDGICLVIPNIKVPISKSCIFVSDVFLRLTIGKHHLEVNFYDKIDTSSIRVTENNGIHHIHLNKQKRKLWPEVMFQGTKGEILQRKEKSLLRRELEVKHRIDSVRENRLTEERITLRGQMHLEKEERDEISRIKAEEQRFEQQKLYESMNQLVPPKSSDTDKKKDRGLIITSEKRIRSSPIRQACTVRFTHSFRLFKTPTRESTSIQEQAYILKNRPHMKGNYYFNLDEYDLGLQDAILLKEKGDEMYAKKDFLSAINVYSAIIDIDPFNISAYSNRSAAYLMIDEPFQCIRDCKKIDDILKSNSEREQVIVPEKKMNLRLSLAYFQLDVLGRSNGFDLALKHVHMGNDRHDESFRTAYEGDLIKTVIQCRNLKRKGDLAMRNMEFSSAIEFYTSAIDVGKENTLLSVYVNRASAFAACSKHIESINDCTFVLEALKGNLSDPTKVFSAIPKYGTDERRTLVEICITKRAHNYFKLNEWNACQSDLLVASILSHEKVCLEGDLDKVQRLLLISSELTDLNGKVESSTPFTKLIVSR